MKRIICLFVFASAILTNGCVFHDHHRGGAYGHYERSTGHYRWHPHGHYDYHRGHRY